MSSMYYTHHMQKHTSHTYAQNVYNIYIYIYIVFICIYVYIHRYNIWNYNHFSKQRRCLGVINNFSKTHLDRVIYSEGCANYHELLHWRSDVVHPFGISGANVTRESFIKKWPKNIIVQLVRKSGNVSRAAKYVFEEDGFMHSVAGTPSISDGVQPCHGIRRHAKASNLEGFRELVTVGGQSHRGSSEWEIA